MFKWFKPDPAKKLKKQYLKKLEDAMQAQRNGKIYEYSFLTEEAEALKAELDALEQAAT